MPKIYLSPSTQEYNQYYSGENTEEQVMNILADLLEPYLFANGIGFDRNTPEMTAGSSIRASNAGDYDFHLALHTNASPESMAGRLRGIDVYYFPYSFNGSRMADIMVENLKTIYPDPNLVTKKPSTSLGEVDRTKAPSNLLELGYHDNAQDEQWILENLSKIAYILGLSLTEYFGLPFIEPTGIFKGKVNTQESNLNIRNRPTNEAKIIGSVPKNAFVDVYGQTPSGWRTIKYGDTVGFVWGDLIKIID